MYAKIQQREVVNGPTKVRRRDILRMVTAEDGDVALPEPGDDRRIKPCRPASFGTAAKPRSNFFAACPHARAHEQCIADRYLDARLLFPCLQVLHIDGRTRLQIRNTFEPGDVDQDAARENSVLDVWMEFF